VTTDVVVVLPGILGSTLEKDGKPVWAPSLGAVAEMITSFGHSIPQLRLPAGIGDDDPGDGVEAVALMPDIHILPGVWTSHLGYDLMLGWLRTTFGLVDASTDRAANLLPVPYDWRLSNRYNGRVLKGIVEPALERWRSQGPAFADAKLTFICHSMGGLVARWFIEKEGGAEITRRLITLGTPYRGALRSLDQLVNGVRKGVWPFTLDLTEFARSLPSSYQLLPEYACIETPNGLRKLDETPVPDIDTAMTIDALRFHDEMDEAAETHPIDTYTLHPFVGTRQRTVTTARVASGRVELAETIDGKDEGGDATVPRLAAAPKAVDPDSNVLRWPADKHGSLQSNKSVLDEIAGILTANPVHHRGLKPDEIRVDIEEVSSPERRSSLRLRRSVT
jgi:pimeloyl-ACP methyl ester carboxylesterase